MTLLQSIKNIEQESLNKKERILDSATVVQTQYVEQAKELDAKLEVYK